MKDIQDIPEEKMICKYCWHCNCTEESNGYCYCNLDIGDLVNVNEQWCDAFDYDDTFVR
ncbi:hypothetical protein [Mediterraneibacter gnavus]|uniref:hypothetical protein n=1 Tax=Mediterraneibacter gnavus TaxID=33038 RepID=UPI00232ABCEB|nr:hypothetical protein [Mediterraneibacter gnavus]MDB8715119.1 hypothetical protein [Mediterraneibacter gnavus]